MEVVQRSFDEQMIQYHTHHFGGLRKLSPKKLQKPDFSKCYKVLYNDRCEMILSPFAL